MEMKMKTMRLPAHARIIMSLWCRLLVQFYTLPNQQGAPPAPFVLSFALSVTPSFWHHPPFFPSPSMLHGLCLYQFVALTTRGAFLSGPLICSMLHADLLSMQ